MRMVNTESENGARTCVIVSYWNGVGPRRLHKLLDQMRRIDAGSPFDLVIVCNGGDKRPLTLPRRFDRLKPKILNRENDNYNLGAWDHGWKNSPNYKYYLFLQDDCFIKKFDWLQTFERRMDLDVGVGLLGEAEAASGRSWDYMRAVSEPSRPAGEATPETLFDHMLARFREHDVPMGPVGHHIRSIILFTSVEVLDEVGGFRRFGPSKWDAIAAEIAFSRDVAARGYRIATVSSAPFQFIGHAEWRADRSYGQPFSWRALPRRCYWTIKSAVKLRLGIRHKPKLRERNRPAPEAPGNPFSQPPAV